MNKRLFALIAVPVVAVPVLLVANHTKSQSNTQPIKTEQNTSSLTVIGQPESDEVLTPQASVDSSSDTPVDTPDAPAPSQPATKPTPTAPTKQTDVLESPASTSQPNPNTTTTNTTDQTFTL